MEQHSCRECKLILQEETVGFGGMVLRYQLLVCPEGTDRFRIRVTLGEESDECWIADRIEHALERYRLLVRGCVTPCCLREVLDDWCG